MTKLNSINKIIPKAKYQCRKCSYYYELDRPGPTLCPKCGYVYVDWINHIEVLDAINERRIDENKS